MGQDRLIWLLLVLVVCATSRGLDLSIGENGSNVQTLHASGVLGEDVNVGLISARNVLSSHEAFFDKDFQGQPTGPSNVINYDFSGSGISASSHDTAMAGIAISRGDAAHPQHFGVAPAAMLHCARVAASDDNLQLNWIEDALDELILQQDCKVIFVGLALSTLTPNGDSVWTKAFDYYAYNHDVVFVLPAGNEDEDIAVFGDAYNGLTVGGLALEGGDFYGYAGADSGSGPTEDLRQKPEVTSPSQSQQVPSAGCDTCWQTVGSSGGQTSFSVPHGAGVCALLVGRAGLDYPAEAACHEVIKAAVTNSAFPNINDKDQNYTAGADANTWHPDRGYGKIDGRRAYETLCGGIVAPGTDIQSMRGWSYESVSNPYQQHVYRIYAQRNERLLVTVTWDRQITKKATYIAESEPRFDVSLDIIEPSGSQLCADPGGPDNLIKADVLVHESGFHEVMIANTTNKHDRNYALAFEILQPVPGDFYPADSIAEYADLADLADLWLDPGQFEEDLSGDMQINLVDFAVFANHWLEVDPRYYPRN